MAKRRRRADYAFGGVWFNGGVRTAPSADTDTVPVNYPYGVRLPSPGLCSVAWHGPLRAVIGVKYWLGTGRSTGSPKEATLSGTRSSAPSSDGKSELPEDGQRCGRHCSGIHQPSSVSHAATMESKHSASPLSKVTRSSRILTGCRACGHNMPPIWEPSVYRRVGMPHIFAACVR